MSARPMRVLGLMSGTSADGIDVALVRISGRPPRLRAKLEKFACISLPRRVRETILRVAGGESTTTAEISRLNFLIGELFARAAIEACRGWRVPMRSVDLIGSHGQTIYHQGTPAPFLSAGSVAATMQIGEPAVIAERTGVTTIADFRPADLAAGGQGAPLVPMVDYLLFRDARRGRTALNIGGIANVTVIPPGARPQDVFAFDTGPGNMVIDALLRHFSAGKKTCDRNSKMARRGRLEPALLAEFLHHPYLQKLPPKSAGREEFGAAFVDRVITWGRRNAARPEDLVHTATVLTAVTIADAFQSWILPKTNVSEVIVSGGGIWNPLLMEQLKAGLPRIAVVPSGKYGVPEDAKEAFAFAVLAFLTWTGHAGNLPGATGARHIAVLGKVVAKPPHS